jgi:hypothetical protein
MAAAMRRLRDGKFILVVSWLSGRVVLFAGFGFPAERDLRRILHPAGSPLHRRFRHREAKTL